MSIVSLMGRGRLSLHICRNTHIYEHIHTHTYRTKDKRVLNRSAIQKPHHTIQQENAGREGVEMSESP